VEEQRVAPTGFHIIEASFEHPEEARQYALAAVKIAGQAIRDLRIAEVVEQDITCRTTVVSRTAPRCGSRSRTRPGI
jgi:hypothetical protein